MNEIAKVLNNHKVLINMQVGHNLIANKRVGPNNCVCRNFLKNIPGATFMPESSVHQFFFVYRVDFKFQDTLNVNLWLIGSH